MRALRWSPISTDDAKVDRETEATSRTDQRRVEKKRGSEAGPKGHTTAPMTTKHAQHITTRPTFEVVADACASPASWQQTPSQEGQYAAGNCVKSGTVVDLRSMFVTIHDPGSGG